MVPFTFKYNQVGLSIQCVLCECVCSIGEICTKVIAIKVDENPIRYIATAQEGTNIFNVQLAVACIRKNSKWTFLRYMYARSVKVRNIYITKTQIANCNGC